MQHVAADLVAPLGSHPLAAETGEFVGPLPVLTVQQAGTKDAHGIFPVLVLGAFGLAGDDDAGGQVGEPDGGGDLLDVLSTRAAGTEEVHLEVIGADFDLGLLLDGGGQDLHLGEGGVAEVVGVVGGQSDEAVNAIFSVEISAGVGAADLQRRSPQSGLVAVGQVHYLEGTFFLLGPAGVHAEKHLGPVVGVGPARAGTDGYDGGPVVVAAG